MKYYILLVCLLIYNINAISLSNHQHQEVSVLSSPSSSSSSIHIKVPKHIEDKVKDSHEKVKIAFAPNMKKHAAQKTVKVPKMSKEKCRDEMDKLAKKIKSTTKDLNKMSDGSAKTLLKNELQRYVKLTNNDLKQRCGVHIKTLQKEACHNARKNYISKVQTLIKQCNNLKGVARSFCYGKVGHHKTRYATLQKMCQIILKAEKLAAKQKIHKNLNDMYLKHENTFHSEKLNLMASGITTTPGGTIQKVAARVISHKKETDGIIKSK